MMRALVLLALAAVATVVHADPAPLLEQRYCGPPARTASGEIKRRSDVRAAFQKAHPCPSTGATTGACPGWEKDHVVPLACNGCDSVSNMAWMPKAAKSAPGQLPKDRWERRVYCDPVQLTPMP